MKIAVIDNYDSFVHNLVRYVRETVTGEVRVMRNDRADLSYLDACDAIVLSPGPGIPSEAGDLMKIIERYVDKKKMLGVCLGHQALAEHFGMSLEPALPIHHGKSSEISLNESVLFSGLPKQLQVGRYHSWRVRSQHTSAMQTIATGPQNDIMALQHETLPIYGVQFHPESILTPQGRNIIQNWINLS